MRWLFLYFEEEDEVDIAAVQREIAFLETELAEVRNELKKYLTELGASVKSKQSRNVEAK